MLELMFVVLTLWEPVKMQYQVYRILCMISELERLTEDRNKSIRWTLDENISVYDE